MIERSEEERLLEDAARIVRAVLDGVAETEMEGQLGEEIVAWSDGYAVWSARRVEQMEIAEGGELDAR